MSVDGAVADLRASTPARLDLTAVEHEERVHAAADRVLARAGDVDVLDRVEARLFADEADRADGERSIGAHVAAKLARSKARVRRLRGERHLSVVLAVYKEHRRILPRAQDPVGEDFLRRKLRQLAWLFEKEGGSPGFGWDLTVVDDGCPEGSGAIAERILAEDRLGAHGRVLALQDAIDAGHPAVAGLRSTAESRKGGSIEYGMARAVEEARPGHVVLYTDADLSTNLGQAGLLVDALEGDRVLAAIGSRRQPTSVVIKQGRRNVRGKLFIFLWKRLLAPLRALTDTQCGFKAFPADVVRDVFPGARERGFAFDLELLLKVELHRPGAIARVPVAWIDSEAASTTTDMAPYLPMLAAVVGMYRRYLPSTLEADDWAAFVESLDPAAWERLLDAVPRAIADGDPCTFDDAGGIAVADLRRALA